MTLKSLEGKKTPQMVGYMCKHVCANYSGETLNLPANREVGTARSSKLLADSSCYMDASATSSLQHS